MAEPPASACAIRGLGVVSTLPAPGLLDELDELELESGPGCCAHEAGAEARLASRNATAAVAIGRCRDKDRRFRQNTIEIRL